MVDNSFFNLSRPMRAAELSEISGCEVHGESNSGKLFRGVSPIESAGPDDVTFLSNPKYVSLLDQSKAGACILSAKYIDKAPKGLLLLLSDNPYAAYAKIATAFHPYDNITPSISTSAHINKSAVLASDCQVADNVFIDRDVKIGNNTCITYGAYIGRGVKIGDNCFIGHGVTLTHCIIGNNVIIHPGVRIGQDGFGFATERGTHIKVPQLGRVIVEDNVEIGANTCIDRGAGPDTIIGAGTKIDNLVQIGHNVQIGKGCIIISQTGISGSTKLGDYVVLGGQVGIAGHLKIGNMVNVAAQSGVAQDVMAKEIIGGSPAVPIKQWHRQTVMLKKLVTKKGSAND